jgi:hypothetical protein
MQSQGYQQRKELCSIRDRRGLSQLRYALSPWSQTNTNNGTDALLERNRQVLGFESALDRDVVNLQNWVDGNGCIAREETAYLARAEDLLRVVSPDDNAVTWLGALVADSRVYFRERFGQVRNPRLELLMDAEHSTASSA